MAVTIENPIQTFLDNLHMEKTGISVRIYTEFLEIHKDQIIKMIQDDDIGTKGMIYDILLNIVVHMNDTDYAETLLLKLFETGINPNVYTPTNHSVIFYASLHYRHRLVKVLLENRADPNVPTRNTILSNENSPLEFLLNLVYSDIDYNKKKEDRLKTIQLLLDYGTFITDIPMLQQLKNEYIAFTTQNTISDNIKFYLKYRKNITIESNTIIMNILQIKPPFSLQTLCKFTVVNDLKLDLRDLVDNRIIPDCITC